MQIVRGQAGPGKIVGESQYKSGSVLKTSPLVDDPARAFAQKMVNLWQPDLAFVLDVADTDDGYKVVEINCINFAGFYNVNMQSFVAAIESMETPDDAPLMGPPTTSSSGW